MTLRLHGNPDTASLIVRLALEDLGLAYEMRAVEGRTLAERTPGYLALNPQGLIPALEDGGLVLWETGAMLVHLADRAGRLGAEGPAADEAGPRARFLRWTFFLANTLHAELRMHFFAERYLADPGAAGTLRAGLAARWPGHLGLIEAALDPAGGLVGPTVTLPDLYLAALVRWMRIYPEGQRLAPPAGPSPLAGLLARVEAGPAVARAAAAEGLGPTPFTDPSPLT